MKVAIIDSGLNYFDSLGEIDINGINLCDEQKSEDFSDNIGHGTAVVDILNRTGCLSSIFIVKIFGDYFTTSFDMLFNGLKYVYDNLNCNIILVSLGVKSIVDHPRLYTLIDMLNKKNCVVISAFDNLGSLSYPASYNNVIGVDVTTRYNSFGQLDFNENSPVDIVMPKINYRVKWTVPKTNIVTGTSFSAANVAGLLTAEFATKTRECNIINCRKYLKNLSLKTEVFPLFPSVKNALFHKMNKAIVFPFNKEIHSLAKYEDMLTFDIEAFSDIRQSGLVGQEINSILSHISCNKTVKDFTKINWESDFDSVILGHTTQLNNITNINYKLSVIEKCIEYNKLLYSFDDISYIKNNNLKYFCPIIDNSHIPKYNLGKLHRISAPVIGIFGTSSRQGKYTLQLNLRRLFEKHGYIVSQVSSEPSGYLFGFDFVYPMGYQSSVYVSNEDAVATLNEMMHKCDLSNPDVIIVGSQSGTIPYCTYNTNYLTLTQMEFLSGTEPDLFVLCVNYHDNIDYISRTVSYLESVHGSKVIGCVLYPLYIKSDNSLQKKLINIEEYEQKRFEIQKHLNLKLYLLSDATSILDLFHCILNFFSAQ